MPVKMINNKNKNNPFQCLGICQRLFNFVVLNFLPKRVTTTSRSMRQGSTAVPMFSAAPQSWNKIEYHKAQTQAQSEKSVQVKPRRPGPAQTVRFSDEDYCNDEEERVRERKGKSVVVSGEKLTLGVEVNLPNNPPPCSPPSPPPLRQRQVRPLFDVAVNINEKSDAFIRSRKEAMRRNYSLET